MRTKQPPSREQVAAPESRDLPIDCVRATHVQRDEFCPRRRVPRKGRLGSRTWAPLNANGGSGASLHEIRVIRRSYDLKLAPSRRKVPTAIGDIDRPGDFTKIFAPLGLVKYADAW
jgi:hypothetical protein